MCRVSFHASSYAGIPENAEYLASPAVLMSSVDLAWPECALGCSGRERNWRGVCRRDALLRRAAACLKVAIALIAR